MFSKQVNTILSIGMFGGLFGVANAGDHNNYWLGIPSAFILVFCIGALMWESWYECKIKTEAFYRFGDDIEGLNKWLEAHGFDRIDEDEKEEEIPDLENANTPWILDVLSGKVYDKNHDVVLTYVGEFGTKYYTTIWIPNMKNIVNYVNETNWQ